MCDYGRLNFHYVNSEDRLKTPLVRLNGNLETASWTAALARMADALREFPADQIAVVASARMTNEELWLTKQLIEALGTPHHEVVPHWGEADDLLLNADRNPNTAGARLLGITTDRPGEKLAQMVSAVRSGEIKVVVALGEDLLDAGFSADDLARLSFLGTLNILPNPTVEAATVVWPGAAFAEKRGSMVNAKGRLQRLNRAIRVPGHARDDWEILRDLLQLLSGSDGVYLIEDVFKQIAGAVPAFRGLSLSKIGDGGYQLEDASKAPFVPAAEPARV
jgi:NADH-quinone oxidoreductase subunit G